MESHTGSVTNLASATGLFNNQPIISSQTVATVRYKQPTSELWRYIRSFTVVIPYEHSTCELCRYYKPLR
jgi:hypothetical protein